MTRDEVTKISQGKMDKINELAKSLQVELVAKQYVDARTGIINLVVIYNDLEKYDIVEDAVVREPETSASDGDGASDSAGVEGA